MMKWWIRDTSNRNDNASTASVSVSTGLPVIPAVADQHRGWSEMAVSAHYREMFALFLRHYEHEVHALAGKAVGGEETSDHERLVAHTEKLVKLTNFISIQQIEQIMKLLSDEDLISGSVDGQELRKRVENGLALSGLPTVDLSDRMDVFNLEIKRRVKQILVNKLKAAVDAVGKVCTPHVQQAPWL